MPTITQDDRSIAIDTKLGDNELLRERHRFEKQLVIAKLGINGDRTVVLCDGWHRWKVRSAPASVECKTEIPVVRPDVHAADIRTRHEPIEKFAANFRQKSVRDQGVDHARTTFEFGATFTNQLWNAVLVRKWHFVIGLNALLDAAEVQLNDRLKHFLADRVKRHNYEAIQQRIRKYFYQRAAERFFQALGTWHDIRVLAHVDDDVLGSVCRENDDCVFEID